MKKLKVTIAGLMLLGFTAATVNAQDKQADSKKDKKATATKTIKAGADAKGTTGQHLKKDGTPDKRYKENKQPANKNSKKAKAAPVKSGKVDKK